MIWKKPPEKHFEKEVVEILRTPADGDRGTEIAVVRWIADGVAYQPQLINQEVYIDRLDKKRKHGKMKGYKYDDFVFLMKNGEKIKSLLLDMPPRGDRPPKADARSKAANDPSETMDPAGHLDDDIVY